MSLKSETIYRILTPYIDKLCQFLLSEDIDFEEASIESFADLICLKTELTIREMTHELNTRMQNGELSSLRQLILENPKNAKKAARYASKILKHRIRRILEEELIRSTTCLEKNPGGEKYEHNK
ncbi:MAG: hypothetical protein QM398_07065 [Thermoproteota archaeon]|nr:hypothetical protein [Thermoproteota archaeon]NLD66307.1 hypothetical protein [Thermoproteota archaeon]